MRISETGESTLSISGIAAKAHLNQSTLNLRSGRDKMSADQVIAICKAYSYDVMQALIELNFISKADANRPAVTRALKLATDTELVNEIARRLADANRDNRAFDKPVLEVVDENIDYAAAENDDKEQFTSKQYSDY